MPAASLLCLLALTEADQPTLVWWVIGALIGTGPALYYWLKVWEMFQGRKVDHSQYVTRAEFMQAKEDRDRQIASTVEGLKADFSNVTKLVRDLQNDLPAIHRALGRLEGHDEAQIKGNRPR